jgi:RHS repeat-associated protein
VVGRLRKLDGGGAAVPVLGLYYLRARYMNPVTGRFMSRDPKEFKPIDPAKFNSFYRQRKPTDPKKLHKYLYAGGDPVNLIDPRGESDAADDAEASFESLEVYQEQSANEFYRINTTRTLQKLEKILDDITCLADCEDDF